MCGETRLHHLQMLQAGSVSRLSWALVFNPHENRHQVVPLWSQVFGSLGGVMAWFRVAKFVQHVMESLFGIVIMIYVDDCFWIVPDVVVGSETADDWIAGLFKEVVEHLMGWSLDPAKTETGRELPLLGIQVSMVDGAALWSVDGEKASIWSQQIEEVLRTGVLSPGQASKLCGRLAFLNSKIFNRLGRSLIRPLIWRQTQADGTCRLTKRLRRSLCFIEGEVV